MSHYLAIKGLLSIPLRLIDYLLKIPPFKRVKCEYINHYIFPIPAFVIKEKELYEKLKPLSIIIRNKNPLMMYNIKIDIPQNVELLLPTVVIENDKRKHGLLDTNQNTLQIESLYPYETLELIVYGDQRFIPKIIIDDRLVKSGNILQDSLFINFITSFSGLSILMLTITVFAVFALYEGYESMQNYNAITYLQNKEFEKEYKYGALLCEQPHFYNGPRSLINLIQAIPPNQLSATFKLNEVDSIEALLKLKHIVLCKSFIGNR